MFSKITQFLNNISLLVQPVLDRLKTKDLEKKLPRNYIKEREYISTLIFDVVTEKLLVKDALLNFPKDLDDPSAVAAYHALIHYEADEDLRVKDALYKRAQDDYLIYIAETFHAGKKLPKNIINGYKPYHTWAPSLFSNTQKGVWSKLKRVINI